jgi:hypothetical protein
VKLTGVIALALALSNCTLPPPAAPAPPVAGKLDLVDLTDDFARVHDRDAALPDAERATRLKAEFASLLPGFYDEKRLKVPAEKYDANIIKHLKAFPEKRAGVERVSREFAASLAPAQRSFEAEFGPMTGYPPVYLVYSMNEFDGGTRDLPEGTRLLFGADVIDRIYKTVPIQPFFHHELFHLMHNRTFSECDQLWCAVWTEGLATYVAAKLNPGADDAALLLNFPRPLRTAVEANRTKAICAVVSRLNSTSEDDYKPLFMGGGTGLSPELPPRFGYYVGYLVAQDLAKTRSLKQLAAMGHAEARPLIEQSLRRMAQC